MQADISPVDAAPAPVIRLSMNVDTGRLRRWPVVTVDLSFVSLNLLPQSLNEMANCLWQLVSFPNQIWVLTIDKVNTFQVKFYLCSGHDPSYQTLIDVNSFHSFFSQVGGENNTAFSFLETTRNLTSSCK